ncbi:MAG: CUAEP/CCAEP-tail radical SAM (seleno)protein, partial [Acidimicrobiales bacterium]
AVAAAIHQRFPELTFDATVKVEHVLKYPQAWPELQAFGLSFVVSAFESTDDEVLRLLDKGHTTADEARAVAVLRSADVEVRPSWLPFSPWTTFASLGRLLEFSARADLVASTDPVQYSIRLLLPRGSLLLAAPDAVLSRALSRAAGHSPSGSRSWVHDDGRIDDLQQVIARLVEDGAERGQSPTETFAALWSACLSAGVPLEPEPPAPAPEMASGVPGPDRPRLSEAWFCCAEPTGAQLDLLQR